jgi:hypothetical protein
MLDASRVDEERENDVGLGGVGKWDAMRRMIALRHRMYPCIVPRLGAWMSTSSFHE